MPTEFPLNRDFREFLGALRDAEVEHVVIGGFAVAAHGFVRATKDLDVFVRASAANAKRMVRALAAFGAPRHSIDESDFVEPGVVVQLGVPPRRIDLVTRVSGVSFDEAASGAVVIDIDGLAIPVLGLEALLANKRASGRAQDLRDVRELLKLQRESQSKKKRESIGASRTPATKKVTPRRRPR